MTAEAGSEGRPPAGESPPAEEWVEDSPGPSEWTEDTGGPDVRERPKSAGPPGYITWLAGLAGLLLAFLVQWLRR